jgi:two-component system chemotaxis sensor kinase CheA
MPAKKDELKVRLLATFQVEAREHLQAITAHLLTLDRGLPPAEAREVVEAMFREVHTLKGAARSVSLTNVEALCQALESTLSRITRGDLDLSRPILNSLQDGVDGVARLLTGSASPMTGRDLLERAEPGTVPPDAEAPRPVQSPEALVEASARAVAPGLPAPDTIRLSAVKLDTLLLQAEDLLIPKLVAGERVGEVRALAEALAGCRAALDRMRAAQRRSPANGRDAELRAGLESTLRAVDAQAQQLLAHLVRDHRTIAGAVDGVLDEMRRIRMTPASTILDLFPRMVRDLAREQGKAVEWVTRGADLELDRKVLEVMKEPLIHLVRNAIDHGIELPEVRTREAKSSQGRVTLALALLEGNRIEIVVADDGRGIDLIQVKAAATRARLLSLEQAQAITDEDALPLVLRSGLSTNPIITDVSGHGLGLAIVKEHVERLGGNIRVESQARSGTTVRMVLPATIATFRALMVRAGGQRFLLPLDAVEQAVRIAPDNVEGVEGRQAIRWNGHPLPVSELARLLGLPEPESPAEPASKRPCVVVSAGEERAGLLVEEIVGDREVLVKEFRPPLLRVRNVAGAGLLGTGQMVLILRTADLLRSVKAGSRPPRPTGEPEKPRRATTVLVVDDSITTRTMEKNLLEAVGYQVKVAVDGIEAWTLLKSEQFDLVVSDVDMPRMDGFALTSRIRTDRSLTELPVVLVTALESREDKERGIEVGANAYVVKSSFDQSNLLEIIRRLV